jgi:hypothetical protein
MKTGTPILLLLAAATLCASGAMAADDDYIMGNYHGAFSNGKWKTRAIRAEVAAMPMGRYRAVFYAEGGGGQAYRDQIFGRKTHVPAKTDTRSQKRQVVVEFAGTVKADEAYAVKARLTEETLTGTFDGSGRDGEFRLERVFVEPPTRGMAPPEGAIVLLDGKTMDQWQVQPHWMLQADGSIRTAGSNIISREEFGDAEYHIEFMTPFMPDETGQARGNSGVYLMGRYELQVLDSFGDLPADNLCGGIYQKAVPVVCASLPPLQWQTYDITFTAPRFGADGKKTADARITVLHNGVRIHDDVVLPGTTPGGVSGDEAGRGPLLFQDHNDPVRFRNVWVKPLG